MRTAPFDIEYAKRSSMPTMEAMEARFRMTPPFCVTIWLTAACRQLYAPLTLTLYILSRSCGVVFCTLPTCPMPALLTRMSMVLNFSMVAAKAVCTCAWSVTSVWIAMAVLGRSVFIWSAVSCAAWILKSRMAMFAFCFEKVSAIAFPMPDPAPVMIAVLF